mgnify:CR=1 FL=1
MINGNISGLKEYVLENLDKLYSVKIEKGKIINQEIVEYISEISNKINREINIVNNHYIEHSKVNHNDKMFL